MRLIDADELIKQIEADAEHIEEPLAKMFLYANISDIKHAPTIAQPEIIRCRECKYNDMPPTAGNAGCTLLYGMTDQNGFCHMAERRTDDQT